jgi:hypothetical protein
MDPVYQRHNLEILDATLQLGERRSVSYELSPLNGDPAPAVGVAVCHDPSELQGPIGIRHLTGRDTGWVEHLLEAGQFAIVRIRLQRFRRQGTSLHDTIALNQRANSCGVVAG